MMYLFDCVYVLAQICITLLFHVLVLLIKVDGEEEKVAPLENVLF